MWNPATGKQVPYTFPPTSSTPRDHCIPHGGGKFITITHISCCLPCMLDAFTHTVLC